MQNIEDQFTKPGSHSLTSNEVEFLLRGVSLTEHLEVGTITTASSCVEKAASRDVLRSGYMRGMLDSFYVGQRISDVLDNWIETDEWHMPSLTELVGFAVEKTPLGGVLVGLTPYEVGKPQESPWVPYVREGLLGMWPIGTILPSSSSILLVRG